MVNIKSSDKRILKKLWVHFITWCCCWLFSYNTTPCFIPYLKVWTAFFQDWDLLCHRTWYQWSSQLFFTSFANRKGSAARLAWTDHSFRAPKVTWGSSFRAGLVLFLFKTLSVLEFTVYMQCVLGHTPLRPSGHYHSVDEPITHARTQDQGAVQWCCF